MVEYENNKIATKRTHPYHENTDSKAEEVRLTPV
jgi:hypothetical protein